MRGMRGLKSGEIEKRSEDLSSPAVFAPARRRGWRLPLGFGMRLYLESRFLIMLLVAVAIGIFGAICANEWLYFLASSFMCAGILGAILPLIILADIKVGYSLPREVLSSEDAAVILKLNRGRILGPLAMFFPVKWLRLSVDVARRGKDGRTFEKILPPEPVLVETLDRERWFEFPTPLLSRGIYKLKGVELSTCFPLGVCWWARHIKVGEGDGVSITVYPRIHELAGNFLQHLRGVPSTMGQAHVGASITLQSSSFRSVREWQTGDSRRHIHWPLTAKAGELLVKQFDQETLPVFNLLLNLRSNWRSQEQFELAVTTILSLCHYGYKLGQVPNLILFPPVSSAQCFPLMSDLPRNVNQGLELVSEILARVEPVSSGTRLTDEEKERFSKAAEFEEYEAEIQTIERDLLSVFPTGEQVMKYNPQKGGDIICTPVELAIIQSDWAEEEPERRPDRDRSVNFGVSRPKRKESDSKREMGPVDGLVIGRIEWEADLEML